MFRKLMTGTLGALTLAFLGLGFGSAEASPVTPNGFCGAKNMVNDSARPHMIEAMTEHTAPQGDAGMAGAVANTLCD